MLELDASQIQMGRAAANKDEALAMLADALASAGLATAAYLDGLQAREHQGSTFLGQGIAIPHGTPQTRDQVLRTGVSLIQFPAGVDWGDGQRVYLAIAIAAQSDEHLHLLQLLTRALGEGDLSQALREAGEATQILELLQGAPQALALDGQLVALGQAAEDFDELLWQGARLLRQAGCARTGFALGLARGEPLPLERLCDVLIGGRAAAFSEASDSRQVIEALGGEVAPDWPSLSVPLLNAHGLHARPAKALSELAQGFAGEIRVRLLGDGAAGVSAKSLSRLLALGARRGQMLEFSAEPAIAETALPALRAALQSGLGETVEPLSEALPEVAAQLQPVAPVAPVAGARLLAVGASPGIAIGPALVRTPPTFHFAEQGQGVEPERARLEQALAVVSAQIQRLVDGAGVASIREIFSAHLAMLGDPALREDVEARLGQGASAEAAWQVEVETAARRQEALHDALLAERAADLRDIGNRVLAQLCGVALPSEPDEPYILVMAEVVPSDVAGLDRRRVAGILTARGGATAHSAIIARALGIPALVGAGDGVLQLAQGTPLLLDGDSGVLRVAPDARERDQALQEREAAQRRQEQAHARRFDTAQTRDGVRVEVAANIGASGETADAVELGAEAVGLLRTELVFMEHAQAPDQAAQQTEYRRVLDALAGRPLVVRTLDVGGDKPLPYWPMPAEENPFLGVRGIRLSLQRPDILETQLRALLASADGRPLRIMFPMVGAVEEWRAARDLVQRLREEIEVRDLQLGIMIEVPSAALLAPVLAREVDFFSIGTNDLTQYCLAIDRGHPQLSAQADGLHPAVLRLIEMTVTAAHAQGKWVGVCGELASDRLAVPLLIGLGVDELSVTPRSIALVKARVREVDSRQARTLVDRALALDSASAVRALVAEMH